MKNITRKQLKEIGIFDLGRYSRYLLGIDIIPKRTSPCYYRPAMYECYWYFLDSSVGYAQGCAGKVEIVSPAVAENMNAYSIYLEELSILFMENQLDDSIEKIIIYIADSGQTKAESFILLD